MAGKFPSNEISYGPERRAQVNYLSTLIHKNGTYFSNFFHRRAHTSNAPCHSPSSWKNSLKLFDMSDEEKKEKTVLDGVGFAAVSADGKKLLVSAKGSVGIINAAADHGRHGGGVIDRPDVDLSIQGVRRTNESPVGKTGVDHTGPTRACQDVGRAVAREPELAVDDSGLHSRWSELQVSTPWPVRHHR